MNYYEVAGDNYGVYDNHVFLYYQEGTIDYDMFSDENRDLVELVIDKKFKAELGERQDIDLLQKGTLKTYSFVGLGKMAEFDKEALRVALFKGLKGLEGKALVRMGDKSKLSASILGEVAQYLNYDFDYHKSESEKKELILCALENEIEGSEAEGVVLGESVNLARDLVNEPANVIYPKTLAKAAKKCGEETGFEVEVMKEKEIEELKMEAFLSVARAASKRPRLIVMRYKGGSEHKTYGLIGKGLTYDTGGLSLKPTNSMLDMKSDMGGAATVIGTMQAIATMKLPINVTAVIAACENSVAGNAYRPGDIIGSMAGKTIEVNNTDAEGRLTLVDAITYAIQKEGVEEIVDVATLTGAAVVAVGEEVTAAFTNEEELYKEVENSAKEHGELIWQLPTFDFYKESLKSDVADLVNTGSRWGGASSAAKFIEEFVQGKPWLHLDIAASSFYSKPKGYYTKGATGQMVRTLYTYYKNKN